MKRENMVYWISTGLFCAVFAAAGLSHLLRSEAMVSGVTGLGFPIYLTTILGVAKVCGVVALLVPGMPLLKEWAYAGFTFDLLGATAAHAFVGHPLSETLAPMAILALGAVSYAMRPRSRRVGT